MQVVLAWHADFHSQNTLMHPDERQLAKGIAFTDVPNQLKSMVDSLVWESTRTEEGYYSFHAFTFPVVQPTILQRDRCMLRVSPQEWFVPSLESPQHV